MVTLRTDLDTLAGRLLSGVAGMSVDPLPIDRGDSNRVWVADNLVLRMSSSPASRHLIREAQLAELLPEEVGYPRVVGSGVEDRLEWIITELVPGEQLGAKWPKLDDDARVRAIESLWDRLEWVQRTNVERARAIGCTRTPFYALKEEAAAAQLSELLHRGVVDAQTQAGINQILGRLFAAMRDVPVALTHTDAGLHNTIWNDSTAVPIDFEFACVGPTDLDLEMLMRQLLEDPPTFVSRRLIALAEQHLERTGSRDRLIGYAVLRDLWGLLLWLHHADSYGPERSWPPFEIEQWDPWLRLRAHSRGQSPLSGI